MKIFTTTKYNVRSLYKIILLVIFLFIIISRILTVNPIPINQNSVNFALALEEYDLKSSSPHLPGFPVYIFIAKIFFFIGLPALWALILPGILSSALAVFPIFHIGRTSKNSRAGIFAALIYAINPFIWICSLKPTYFSVLLFPFFMALRLISKNLFISDQYRHKTRFITHYAGVIYLAIATGIDIKTLIFILPLFFVIFISYFKYKRKRVIIETINGLIAGICIWAIPFFLVVKISDFINYKSKIVPFSLITESASNPDSFLARLSIGLKTILINGLGIEKNILGIITGLLILTAFINLIRKRNLKLKNLMTIFFIVPNFVLILFNKSILTKCNYVLIISALILYIAIGFEYYTKRYVSNIFTILIITIFSVNSFELLSKYEKTNPPQYSLAKHKTTQKSQSILFCGSSIRLIKYMYPDKKAYGIETAKSINKPFFQNKIKKSDIYITSEVKDLKALEGKLQYIETFPTNHFFFSNQKDIILYKYIKNHGQ